MFKHPTRRWLAGISLAGALVAASAASASAAETDITLDVHFADVTLAAGSAGKAESPLLYSSAPTTLHDLTVQYDISDLAGRVEISSDSWSGECTTPEPDVLRCVRPFPTDTGQDGQTGLYTLTLVPTDSAVDGDEGVLTVSFSAQGFTPVTHQAAVRVGVGVDLAAGDESEFSATPGETFTTPLAVSNVGETTADGAVVIFYHDYAIRADQRYNNCNYDDDRLIFCRFDEQLRPGATYRSALTLALGTDTFAPSVVAGEARWVTPAEFQDYQAHLSDRGISLGRPGTGGTLTLTEQSLNRTARGAQADTDPTNNWSSVLIRVTGNNSTDLEAIGAQLSGEKGAEVHASVGFRNNGPATLDYGRLGSSVTYLEVEVPQGTTAVGVPDSCTPTRDNKPVGTPGEAGADTYLCYPSAFSKVGEQEMFDFTLRIDEVIADAAGGVKVNVPCQCDGGFNDDLTPANDEATILVNAASGSGGEGGGEGDDPSLPITGGSTTVVASVGGLLLTAGAVGFVVAHRRQTRFVA